MARARGFKWDNVQKKQFVVDSNGVETTLLDETGSGGGGGTSASTLTDLNISDGTAGQLLTTDGNNNFSFTSIASASSTEIFADMAALIAKTGMSAGDQGLVLENNKLFMYTGSAWYLIATMINNSPTAITNVDSTYNLATDGTPTVITAVSTDPEGFPLTWSYAVTSGSLGSTATISQTDNVFTITPSTNSVDAGEFSITFSTTDGGSSGIVNKVTSISLAFTVANSRYTTLLATATGTSDNNNITDSSTNNHSITVNGDAMAGTFSPYRSGGYSTYFDGTGDYVTSSSNSSILGSGDFTVELWLYASSIGSDYRCICSQGSAGTSFRMFVNGTTIQVWSGASPFIIYDNSTTANTWYHIAYSHSSSGYSLYVDGSKVTFDFSEPNFDRGSTSINIGGGDNGSIYGYIQDFRITKDLARYTANFTPPTEAFESDANTALLISSSLPYIKDSSSNSHDITVTGDVSIMPFGSYDYIEYNPNVHGGSVYFDGVSDFLSIADDDTDLKFGSGDFTLEMWYKGTDTDQYATLTAKGTGGFTSGDWSLMMNHSVAGDIAFYVHEYSMSGPMLITGDVSTSDNEWVHIAVVRSGNDWNLYVNGVSEAYVDSSITINDTTSIVLIGADYSYGRHLSGFISDYRIVKGTAVYTAAFTPPTAPLSSSGSSLHIKGTDASIIDKSQTANIQLFGNTTGSTTQVKFTDSKSMYFDGTGYVRVEDLDMRGDLTMECWFYQTAAFDSTYRALFSASTYSFTAPFATYSFDGSIHTYLNHTQQLIGGTITQNTWHHVALVRSSGTWTQYVDGVSVATSTINGTYNFAETTDWTIGNVAGSNYPFTGYVQDFRMTTDLARYTANFTPPTLPLKG